MSVQRRRGQKAIVYKLAKLTDNRGNETLAVDLENPTEVTAVFIPQRSSRAEVPGQQLINVTRMIVEPNVPDLNVWNRVDWAGRSWDIVAPPQYHHGSRHVRHVSVDLRERPVEVP